MPSIRQSGNPSLRDWKPAPPPPSQSGQTPAPMDTPGRSPFMLNSMPLMASTGDAFQRQFYGQSNIPSQRILPAKKGAGA
jgi:hypothetical protein